MMRTLRLRDAHSAHHILLTGRGIRALMRDWRVPAMWSPTHRGCHVRISRLPDLRALCDLNGVRLLDEREAGS